MDEENNSDYPRRPSQAEVLSEIKHFKKETKEATNEIRTTLQAALKRNQKEKDIASLVVSHLTCTMCSKFMEKPCICPSCQNIFPCHFVKNKPNLLRDQAVHQLIN
uniref:Uncharacterized protein n=1 Tax=Romanomermis culicivorax TaxID=13658 RepID=A0A915L8T8_ROMCU